jgi:hypothetical protein
MTRHFVPSSDQLYSPEALLLRGSFRLCMKDLRTFLEYVEPHDTNLNVFSHRTYELLLRACTEFEAVCKLVAAERGVALPKTANINHYRDLLTPLHVAEAEVAFTFWNPSLHWFTPFRAWASSQPLSWYRAYNDVKHDRVRQFSAASLANVLLAVSGLFVCLVSAFERPVFEIGESYADPAANIQQVYFREFGMQCYLHFEWKPPGKGTGAA